MALETLPVHFRNVSMCFAGRGHTTSACDECVATVDEMQLFPEPTPARGPSLVDGVSTGILVPVVSTHGCCVICGIWE